MKTHLPISILALSLAMAAVILSPAVVQAGDAVKGAPKLLELQKRELEKIPALVEAEALGRAEASARECDKSPAVVIHEMNKEKDTAK